MESYVTECLINPRESDEQLFTITESGEVVARLKGYAIVPIEQYNELIQQLQLETPAHCLSD